jgi:phosphoserine aminotransferase
MTGETRNQAIIALLDKAVARSPHFVDRQGAIALLRSSINMKLKVTDDRVAKRVALNALVALDRVEEYLGLAEGEDQP